MGTSQDDEPAAWDEDNWISLYCALHQIPVNTPKVAALCRRGHSAVSVVYKQTIGKLPVLMAWWRNHVAEDERLPRYGPIRFIATGAFVGNAVVRSPKPRS